MKENYGKRIWYRHKDPSNGDILIFFSLEAERSIDPLLPSAETEGGREVEHGECARSAPTPDAGGIRKGRGAERREKARAMVEGKLLIRARLNACLGSHFPCRSSPWPKEERVLRGNERGRGEEKWGDHEEGGGG